MSLRSLRWQIQLWHAALLVVLVAVVLVVFYGYEDRVRVARIDAELTGPLIALLPRHIRLPGRPAGGPAGLGSDPDFEKNLEASGHYVRITRSSGEVLYVSPAAPASAPVSAPSGRSIFGRWNGPHRELVSLSPRGDIVILARDGASLAAELRAFTVKLLLLGGAVVLLGILGGHYIAARALRPLRAIGDTARRIAAGRWEDRIPADQAPAELEQLRVVLNDSFDRLADTYEQQRRFTADASHELGTPVAIVLAQTQHALARSRNTEEYVAALAACRRAGERMKVLARDLLDLAAYDAHSTAPRRVECDLAELAREALALVAPIAAARQGALDERLETLAARVDPLGISQILVNLLTNAFRHNAPGVGVTLTLRRADDHAEFLVEDNGRGIPTEALPRIFDRFFRADPARAREDGAVGGSGLGLAIAHRIAALHSGTLTATNRSEGGASFSLRLPLTAPSPPPPESAPARANGRNLGV